MEPSKNKRDIAKIRKDFPILERKIHNKPLCYLDNSATTQKPIQVVDALVDFYLHHNANVHRAIYELGEEATMMYEESREKIAEFIHARTASEIVFTSGTTESINTIAYGWGMKGGLKKGDEIVTTVMEHHSNLIPWYFVQDQVGVKLHFVDVDDEGLLRMDQIDNLITDKTKLVAVTHCSNVLGTINPVREIIKRAREVGALTVIDGAQSVPHFPVDVQSLDCDILAFSGHKMLGPTGIGVLYGKASVLEKIEPMLGGGEMIREVHLGSATWADVPYKFEAGTPNAAGAVGLGAAVDYLVSIGMENVREHDIALTEYALEKLGGIEGLRILGPKEARNRGGLVAFSMKEAHAHDIAAILDAEGIAIRSGHLCAQPIMERFSVPATARASFYIYNTPEDIDRLAKALKRVQEVFK